MKVFEMFEGTKPRTQLSEARIYKGSIKLVESVIALLEDNSIEWEPQPEYKGAKGINTATGDGERLGRVNQAAKASDSTNQIWMKMINQLKIMSPNHRKSMQHKLVQLATQAQKRGIKLTPDPVHMPWMQTASSQFA